MKVEILRGDPIVVRAEGEIDYGSSDELQEAVDTAVRESPKGFVIDLSGVFFIGSLGLQAVLGAYHRVVETGGRMAVVVVHSNAKAIFCVLNMDKLPNFFICDSMEAAERVFSAPEQAEE